MSTRPELRVRGQRAEPPAPSEEAAGVGAGRPWAGSRRGSVISGPSMLQNRGADPRRQGLPCSLTRDFGARTGGLLGQFPFREPAPGPPPAALPPLHEKEAGFG